VTSKFCIYTNAIGSSEAYLLNRILKSWNIFVTWLTATAQISKAILNANSNPTILRASGVQRTLFQTLGNIRRTAGLVMRSIQAQHLTYSVQQFYFDPNDPDALAECLKQSLEDQVLRAQQIARGKQRVEQFTWERTARATVEVYKNQLARQ
jgi:hypothetical protein